MDISNSTNSSTYGRQPIGFRQPCLSLPRVNMDSLVAVSKIRQLISDTGATAEQVIAVGRAKGFITCSDTDVFALIDIVRGPES